MALHFGGAALGVGLAGCSVLSQESTSTDTRLGELSVNNLDSKPHTVHVLMLADDEPVYWTSVQAEPFDPETEQAGGDTVDGYPTDPGGYVLHAWYDSQSTDVWKRFNFSTHDAPCAILTINVGSLDETPGPPSLTIWSGDDCESP